MASRHINILRKYQKSILVVMGVILMVTFTLGTSLDYFLAGSGGPSADEVVVTWKGGKLRQSELDRMRTSHVIAVNFLREVILLAVERGGTPIVNGQPIQPNQPINDPGIVADSSDATLVRTMLLAKKADDLGVKVDHEAVRDFLRQLGFPEVQEGEWEEIARRNIPSEMPMSVGQLFDQLAYELKAQQVRGLAAAGLYLPTQRFLPVMSLGNAWEFDNRLNRRFTIEAYPIAVAPLVAQVGGEPTEAELQALFEKGRHVDPNPASPEPGFHQPYRVAFQYLKVNFAPFLEEAKKQITDEQVAQQYEKDIAQGLHKAPPVKPAPVTPVETAPPAEEATKPGDAEKPADSDKPAEDKPAEDKPAEDKPAEDKPAEDKPAEDKPADEKPADQKPTEAPEEKSSCQEEPAPAADSPAAPPKEEKPATEKPATEKPATEKPATEKPATEKPAEEKPAEEKPAEEKPAATTPPATPLPEAKPAEEPKFKPLAEVADQIRETLAQPIAQEAREAAVKKAVDEVVAYGRSFRRWKGAQEAGVKSTNLKDPGQLKIDALASKHGFEAGKTPLVDVYQIAEYEIGQKVQEFDFRGGQIQTYSFADLAFGDGETLYNPVQANSSDRDSLYIHWRTQEQPAADVSLADKQVREQVVQAWKMQKAFELAKAKAQALADKAQGAKSLKDVVDPAQVISPPAFSWLSTGSTPFGYGGQAQLSDVTGIEMAGQDFMRGVFDLQPGEAGIAPNQPHNTVYVVRVIGQDPPDEQLRTQFLESGMNFQVMNVAQNEMIGTAVGWYEGLEEEMDLVWQQPAVQ